MSKRKRFQYVNNSALFEYISSGEKKKPTKSTRILYKEFYDKLYLNNFSEYQYSNIIVEIM